MAEWAKRADASTSSAVGMLTGRMKEVSTQTEAQASRIAVEVKQQLEKDFEAAVTSAAMTATGLVEGVRGDVQAQVEQIRADAQ